jgi:hypothetical protein
MQTITLTILWLTEFRYLEKSQLLLARTKIN